MDDNAVLTVLRGIIVDVVPEIDPEGMDTGRSLGELGCNSVDRLEIISETMMTLGVSVPIEDFALKRSVESLAAMLAQHAR